MLLLLTIHYLVLEWILIMCSYLESFPSLLAFYLYGPVCVCPGILACVWMFIEARTETLLELESEVFVIWGLGTEPGPFGRLE